MGSMQRLGGPRGLREVIYLVALPVLEIIGQSMDDKGRFRRLMVLVVVVGVLWLLSRRGTGGLWGG